MTTPELPLISDQQRLPSSAVTPQALAWDDNAQLLWMGSRDLRRIYAIDPKKWTVVEEREAPGIPWAAVGTNGSLRFTIGEGRDDDRYIRRFVPSVGFSETDRIACPEFTGSYLGYDGEHVYLSQWYKHRILKLGANGNILRIIEVGAEISGHTFIDGLIYVLRGTEQNGESWTIARLDPQEEVPEIEDIAMSRSHVAHLLSMANTSGRTIVPLTRWCHSVCQRKVRIESRSRLGKQKRETMGRS
jgi:hypothetical protein